MGQKKGQQSDNKTQHEVTKVGVSCMRLYGPLASTRSHGELLMTCSFDIPASSSVSQTAFYICSINVHWISQTDNALCLHEISRTMNNKNHATGMGLLGITAPIFPAFTGQITMCPDCCNGKEMAKHLLLSCSKWTAKLQHYTDDYSDIADELHDSNNLAKFLIILGHLSPHTSTAQWTYRDDTNNK